MYLEILRDVLKEPMIDKTLRARIKLILAASVPRDDDEGKEL